MQTVVIVIHLMAIVALVAVVLLQRSEGGALGMGGGNQFMTMRGQGNVLTRATTILAAIFFATSLAMSVLNRLNAPPTAVLDTTPAVETAPTAPAGGTPATGTGTSGSGGILDQLNKYTSGPPATVTPKSVVPDTSAPAAPAGGTQSAPAGAPAPSSQ